MIGSLRRNWEYKLLSIILATLLYFIASAQRNPFRSISVTLQPELSGLPGGLALKSALRPEVLTLTGPSAALEICRRARIRALVDASGAKEGRSFLPVQYELPEGARGRVEVDAPATLEIELEHEVERLTTVRVLYENAPPPGYEYNTPVANPARVAVRGLASEVERVERVVALLDNSESAGAVSKVVPVVAQDSREQVVSTVELQPERVQVSLGVRKAPATKTLILSPELSGTPASGLQPAGCRFNPSTVLVRGEPATLAGLSSLIVPVSFDKLTGETTRTVTLSPPPGVELVGLRTVTVTLEVRGTLTPLPSPSPTPKGN